MLRDQESETVVWPLLSQMFGRTPNQPHPQHKHMQVLRNKAPQAPQAPGAITPRKLLPSERACLPCQVPTHGWPALGLSGTRGCRPGRRRKNQPTNHDGEVPEDQYAAERPCLVAYSAVPLPHVGSFVLPLSSSFRPLLAVATKSQPAVPKCLVVKGPRQIVRVFPQSASRRLGLCDKS